LARIAQLIGSGESCIGFGGLSEGSEGDAFVVPPLLIIDASIDYGFPQKK